jgi:hypothetical protein
MGLFEKQVVANTYADLHILKLRISEEINATSPVISM